MFDTDEIIQFFLEEAEELLEKLESSLLKLEDNPEDGELIDDIFRTFHTIKGSAAMASLDHLSNYAHEVENLLSQVRGGKNPILPELISIFTESNDCLHSFVSDLKKEKELDSALVENNLNRIKNFSFTSPEPEPAPQPASQPASQPAPTPGKQAGSPTKKDPTPLEKEEEEEENALPKPLGTILVEQGFVSNEDILEALSHQRPLGQILIDEAKLDLSDLEIGLEIQKKERNKAAVSSSKKVPSTRSIRVDIEKLDKLLNMIGEATIHQSLYAQVHAHLESLREVEEQLWHALEKKQEAIDEYREESFDMVDQIETLLMPFFTSKSNNDEGMDKVIELFYYQVAQFKERKERLSQMTKERMEKAEEIHELVLNKVEETEDNLTKITKKGDQIMLNVQDRVMSMRLIAIKGLFSSFRRLVREYSSKSGKKIQLEIYGEETELDKNLTEQLSNPLKHLVRNAMDHGLESPEIRESQGKNPEGRIILGASHKEGHIIIEIKDDGGGIDPQKVLDKAKENGLVKEGEVLSEKEIFDLLCKPGFTTTEEVTQTSGRGVGMDAILKDIESLRGTFEMESKLGIGTTFRIRLPLTLAIIDGMLVKIGEYLYIIPLFSVIESFRPEIESIKKIEGGGELIRVRGEYFPLIRLYRILDLEPLSEDPTRGVVVMVQEAGKKSCLLVDEAIKQQQAVIKSLEENFYEKEGFAGATVLEDGQVSYILDVPGIIRLASAKSLSSN